METTIHDDLIEFYANMIDAETFFKKNGLIQNDYVTNLLCESAKEWDALPCDSEGANSEQNKALDKHIEDTIKRLKK